MNTSTSVLPSELERRALFKVKLCLFIYIAIGDFVWNLDRNNIGFAQLVIGKELAIKATLFGLAAGIIAISSFLMQIPAGLLFEKLGAKRWLTFTMIAWGIVSMAQAFVTNGTQLVVVRFFIGVFEAGFVPGVYCLMTVWLRGKTYGKAAAMIFVGVGLGGILGGPFAGWVLGQRIFGMAGWRSLFLLEGMLTVAWALIAMFIVSDNPRKTLWLKADEQEFMINYLKETETEKSRHGAIEKLNVLQTLRNPLIATLIVSNLLYAGLTATLYFFMPTLLKTAGKGISNQYVGLLAIGPYLLQVVVAIFLGAHADKHNERHWHTVTPLLVAAGGLLLYPLAKQPLVAMLSLALAYAGNAGFNVNFWSTCNMMAGRDTIAKSTALIQAGGQIGIFVFPIVFGMAMDATGHNSLGLYLCVGAYLANFVLMNMFFLKYKAQQKALNAQLKAATVTAV